MRAQVRQLQRYIPEITVKDVERFVNSHLFSALHTAGYDHQCSATELQLPQQCSIHVSPPIQPATNYISNTN